MDDLKSWIVEKLKTENTRRQELIGAFGNIQKEIAVTEGKLSGLMEIAIRLGVVDEKGGIVEAGDEANKTK